MSGASEPTPVSLSAPSTATSLPPSVAMPVPPPQPFKLSLLFRRREDPKVPLMSYPAVVQIWAMCTPTAFTAGLIAGAIRGAALGNALARVAIEKRQVLPKHQKAIYQSYMYGEMARGSLRNAFRMGGFVGILLGVDVLALEYPALSGPIAPAIGGFAAGLAMSLRKGPTAAVSASLLGAAMGLSYGVARKAFDMQKLFE